MSEFDETHDAREDGTCQNCGCDLSGSLGQAECAAQPDEAPAEEAADEAAEAAETEDAPAAEADSAESEATEAEA